MNPLIYIPGQPIKTDDTLRALGLGAMLDSHVSIMWRDIFGNGPDKGRGQLVSFDCPHKPHTSSPVGMNLETQVWHEAAKANELPRGRYWIGWDKLNPPTPEDLSKSNRTPGELVELLDHQLWEVAVSSFVPHRRGIDIETGEEVRIPQSAFAPYVDQCRFWESFFLESGQTAEELTDKVLNLPGGMRFAVDALAMNYRIVPEIADGLELLGDGEVFDIILAATGIATMAGIEREKKTT